MKQIPNDVAEFVSDQFSRRLEFTFAGWPHGQSLMWRATDSSGPPLYVKVHAVPYLFERHSWAFEHWVPHLPCRTPELLCADAARLLMVFAELPGTPLASSELSAPGELEAYRTAGQVAQVFHSLDPEENPGGHQRAEKATPRGEEPPDSSKGPSAGEASRGRMEGFIDLCEGLLEPKLLEWSRSVLGETSIFDGEMRVPCHRDYGPRNWLVQESSGELIWSLIDFERARLDLKYADLMRLWADEWKGRPDRRAAFFEGYGRELSDIEEKRLRLTVLITCLGTVPWAADNGDPAFGARAAETIAELKRSW